jgi:hypothetical protein
VKAAEKTLTTTCITVVRDPHVVAAWRAGQHWAALVIFSAQCGGFLFPFLFFSYFYL